MAGESIYTPWPSWALHLCSDRSAVFVLCTQCCSTGELLGHSLHLGAQHILQCSICCSLSLFQRCAFLHVKMQKCSFLSHQLLIAIIKRDMQAQQLSSPGGWSLSQLSRRLSASWKYPFCLTPGRLSLPEHQECVLCLPEHQDLPQRVGSPRPGDGTAVQVMQQPHSLRLLQWNLSNTDRRTKADQGTHLS